MAVTTRPDMPDDVRYLDDDEIKTFLDTLDKNGDGVIDYNEVEHALDVVHDELAPKAKSFNLHHQSKDQDDLHDFLRSIIGSDAQRIPRDAFADRVKEWKIPSMKQDKVDEEHEKNYMKSLGTWRRIRSYWAVHGPEIAFVALVVGSQLAFGIWQCVKYATGAQYRAAFGWGVVLAKTCAGALYPTMFFLIISMSRYFSTFLRRWYYVSRFINWDLSQEFHIRISIVAIMLATLHAIGHLTGSFLWGSRPQNQDAVANILGPDAVPRPYRNYVSSIPGFTGITALGLFYLLALLSTPQVRKWKYEIFQLGHLLMFPIFGLLMAHGSAALLQWPMLGYFIAFPTLLVLVERVVRVFIGIHRIPAALRVLDSETVELKVAIPGERIWRYKAGQYVFLQVPVLSRFQWHPFTISACVGSDMWLHIKTDGNWTSKLRALGGDSGAAQIKVGINGPFGAPAQRFYDFTHTIVVGSGIGVTPFSGILSDLQAKDDQSHGGPPKFGISFTEKDLEKQLPSNSEQQAESSALEPQHSHLSSTSSATASIPAKQPNYGSDYRRVDFHWMVRDRNHLLWFADLLNAVFRSQIWHKGHDDAAHLDVRIQTHVTATKKNIATHIYRWLLELHRTDEHPESPLTGLLNPTHFGRPDLVNVLDDHYEEMKVYRAEKLRRMNAEERAEEEDEEFKVGVFFCGAPVIGEILADRCRLLSARGTSEGTNIEYHFMMEVFG